MKKLLQLGVLCAILSGALCVSAFAETTIGSGFYDIGSATAPSGVTVNVSAADGTETPVVWGTSGTGTIKTLHLDATRLTVTVSNGTDKDSSQYLVALLRGSTPVPTAENILYIDQASATSGTVNFPVYPMEGIADEEDAGYADEAQALTLIVTSNAEHFTTMATVPLYYADGKTYTTPEYMLGDVNGDFTISVQDALRILQYLADPINQPFDDGQMLAANVNGDNTIDVLDALRIRQYMASGTPLVGPSN